MFGKQLFWLTLGLALGGAALAQETQTPAAGAPASPSAAPAPVDQDAKSREYFTDLELVNQDGETVRFYTDVLRKTREIPTTGEGPEDLSRVAERVPLMAAAAEEHVAAPDAKPSISAHK